MVIGGSKYRPCLLVIASTSDAAADALPDVLLPEGFSLSFGPLRSRARECSRASRQLTAANRDEGGVEFVLTLPVASN